MKARLKRAAVVLYQRLALSGPQMAQAKAPEKSLYVACLEGIKTCVSADTTHFPKRRSS